jgi:hypothetical protein
MRERDVYLDGDPGVDSTRRHMERVLKGSPGTRRWPWFAAVLGGGSLWMLWRVGQGAARGNETSKDAPAAGTRAGRRTPGT